ncbi:amidohydrolase family protein [Actinopolymorpha pittospori]
MENTDPVVDTDVHNAFKSKTELLDFLPQEWHRQWAASGTGGGVYYSPIGLMRRDAVPPGGGTPGNDPAYLDEHHLSPHGIDYAILTGSGVLGLSLLPDPDYGTAIAAAYNDWLAATWLPASEKYKGSIIINASDPVAAAEEIARSAGHPDVVQVLMASAAQQPYGQRFYHPIYAAAEKAGLPIAIHPGTEGRGIAGAPTPAGYPTRYFEWHNILPINYMTHVNSLVSEGVFEKFPDLTFVAIEGGIAWLPHLMWRMDKNYKALRATVPWLKRRPSEYIRKHIRLTTQPIEEPDDPRHLGQIIAMAGAETMIMFSSDYPHWDFDNPRIALSPLDRDVRTRIMSTNAVQLYGLATSRAGA